MCCVHFLSGEWPARTLSALHITLTIASCNACGVSNFNWMPCVLPLLEDGMTILDSSVEWSSLEVNDSSDVRTEREKSL